MSQRIPRPSADRGSSISRSDGLTESARTGGAQENKEQQADQDQEHGNRLGVFKTVLLAGPGLLTGSDIGLFGLNESL